MEPNAKTALDNAQQLVRNHIGACQTSLVEAVMGFEYENVFREDDIINFFDYETEDDELPEILEWWIVTEWLADRLIEEGECVLRNEYGTWWGRTTSGQAIYMDSVIQEIAN